MSSIKLNTSIAGLGFQWSNGTVLTIGAVNGEGVIEEGFAARLVDSGQAEKIAETPNPKRTRKTTTKK